jgi:hypothetical protein
VTCPLSVDLDRNALVVGDWEQRVGARMAEVAAVLADVWPNAIGTERLLRRVYGRLGAKGIGTGTIRGAIRSLRPIMRERNLDIVVWRTAGGFQSFSLLVLGEE